MPDEPIKTERTSEGLRNMLFDTLDQLRTGEINHIQARARTNIAAEIIKISAAEIAHAKALKSLKRADDDATVLKNPSLRLGSDSDGV